MSLISSDTVPHFKRGYRLQHDKVRQQWVIQAPEKAFIADPIAAAILQNVDGIQSVDDIINQLTETFNAPRETIAHDVTHLLSDLTKKGVLYL